MKTILIFLMSTFLNPTDGEWKQLKTEEAVLIEYKLQEMHDDKNDRHISYYVFKLTNLTNEDVEVEYEYSFNFKGETKTSNKDGTTKLSIPANSSVVGDFDDNRNLVFFQKFLPGNSGKKASESKNSNVEINIIQKK